MLQRLNEAVASFRRVADLQISDTTKRAIRENMALGSQLKVLSETLTEVLTENKGLLAKVKEFSLSNGFLANSEKDLARKNISNQKLIKLLGKKQQENDEMIEVAIGMQQRKVGSEDMLLAKSGGLRPSHSVYISINYRK